MKSVYSLTILILLFSCGALRAQDVLELIRNSPSSHPVLFIPPDGEAALRHNIAADSLLAGSARHVIALADQMLDIQPVERIQIGRRLLSVSRTCLKRVIYLATAYRLTGDVKYAERAQTEMLAAARFTDWNPSHFLDVAEMTGALAIGYDGLYEQLDPQARDEIKAAIIDKGLQTSFPGGSWIYAEHNWNQVCHGGLVMGALVVMKDEPELAARIIERAVENLPIAMAQYAPDGAYPEGPGYWNYGTTYNVLLIAALESALGTDFGLSGKVGFLESSDYYVQVTGPTGLFFNYSDSGLQGSVSPAMYWFAKKRDRASLLWREKTELELFLASEHDPENQSNRFFPFVLHWAEPFHENQPPGTLYWKADGITPVAVLRSDWQEAGATFVGIKGGSAGTNHAHMDAGSFVLDAEGVRWAVDLGAQNYNELETLGLDLWNRSQESDRWTIFRLNNLSHNTLIVDGQKQIVDAFAPIIKFSDEGEWPHTIVDMSEVYAGQLDEARRGLALRSDRAVLIQDEIRATSIDASVRWGMVTEAEVEVINPRRALLKQNGKQLTFQIVEPEQAEIEIIDTDTPPQSYDAPNPGTRMISFQVSLDSSEKVRLVVLLSPGGGQIPVVGIRPLSEW